MICADETVAFSRRKMNPSLHRVSHLLLLLLFNINANVTAQFFMLPTGMSQVDCPGPADKCLSLDDYATNNAQPYAANETLRFLPGIHNFNRQLQVQFSTEFALVSQDPSNRTSVSIRCNNSAHFVFIDSEGISIDHLSFIGCGSAESATSALIFENIENVAFSHVWVEDTPCSAISATNIAGSFMVSNSVFRNLLSSGPCTHLVRINLLTRPDSIDTSLNCIRIIDTSFVGGEGGALDLQVYYGVNVELANVDISRCGRVSTQGDINIEIFSFDPVFVDIYNSSVSNSSGIGVTVYDYYDNPDGQVCIRDCDISGNLLGGVYHDHRGDASQRDEGLRVNFIDCRFYRNRGSGITTHNSRFSVSGSMTFLENAAYRGGAVALFGDSYMDIHNNTDILFQGNTASQTGGAIFVLGVNSLFTVFGDAGVSCFYQVPEFNPSIFLNVHMRFVNNSADNGGDAIYGALLDKCTLLTVPSLHGFELISQQYLSPYGSIATFESSSPSLIASDPFRACFCIGRAINCSLLVLEKSVYPGEEFTVSMATVGDQLGTAAGAVHSQFLTVGREDEGRAGPSLERLQGSQSTLKTGCTRLRYTVLSDNSWEIMAHTATAMAVLEIPDRELFNNEAYYYESYNNSALHASAAAIYLATPIFINVTLLSCPLGFVHKESRCVCDPDFDEHGITCNINDETVKRDGKLWVSPAYRNGRSIGVIVHENCPYRYCREEVVNVNLQDPDTQCDFDHSGTLCGGCRSGLSLALGTSECLSCSNGYLALFLAFLLAGVLLVLFLRVLNLTVAEGTINGLILYANIIRANEATFFPDRDKSVFVAWLNLDLGIETCFYDGLNGYGKTWLQFLFPLYVWAIIFAVIITARYSSLVARLFGNTSVPLLATLFLLSYAKLLRTVITILSLSILEYPDGTRDMVWSYDGNIDYGGAKHAPLLVVAILVIIGIWLPYTLVLLAPRLVLKLTLYRGFRWINRLKPFMDAYAGPLRAKHSYWVGVLLLVRTVIFLTSAATQDDAIRLLVIGVTTGLLLAHTSVTGLLYKKWYLSVLETSFFTNLLLLVTATYFTNLEGGSQTAVAYTSVTFAFIEFAIIIALHTFKLAVNTELGKKLFADLLARFSHYQPKEDKPLDTEAVVPQRHMTINLSDLQAETESSKYDTELREPVLDFENSTNL